ncbi:MAG: transcriptional regulator GcvA [Pseudomonadota bacterium]
MRRRSLHFNSLRAFEAAARHLSFSRAADELAVTHSAVSHQIRQLEEMLGIALFIRTNRGVALTEAGHTLLPVLAESFDRIAATLDGLIAAPDDDVLRVTTTPTLAAKWLIPRLGDWRGARGDIAIHLHPALSYLDLVAGEADVAIRCGVPPWGGLVDEFVLPIHLAPVCSQSFLNRLGDAPEPKDLLATTLLHADIAGHEMGEEWRLWFGAAGVAVPATMPGLSFHDPSLALQAAMDGLGIAMGYLELAAADIEAGRLVRPFPFAAPHPFSYYLVYDSARRDETKIAAFREWLLDQPPCGAATIAR